MLGDETPLPFEKHDGLPCATESRVDALHDPLNNLVFSFHGLIETEANRTIDLNSELCRPPGDQMHHLGRAKHGLGGDAPFVDSGAANLPTLHESDTCTELGGHVCSWKPTLTGS